MSYGTEAQLQATRPPVTPYPRHRSPFQTVGMALSILLVLTGVLWLVSGLTSSTTTEEVSLSGDITSLAADLENGDLVVRAGDVEQVELVRTVHRSLIGPHFSEQVAGTTLQITGDCPWYGMGRCGVSYELVVPADLIADVRASSGDVILEGLTGDMVVRSSSGDIVLRSIAGSIDADVSSGDIVLEDVTGDVLAQSSSGDVIADRLSASSVRIQASSGDIVLDLVTAPERVDVESSSGDVTITVPDDGTAYAVVGETSSGDRLISVATDPASPNQARIQTSSGDARFSYPE